MHQNQEIEKLPIQSQDGVTSELNLFRNPKTQNAPVIIIFSAMGIEARYYKTFAQSFVKEGFHCLTSDLRGHGNFSIRPSRKVDFGYKEMVEYDFPATVQKVKEIFPKSNIFLMGHSLGGQMTSLYASTAQEPQLKGLILPACCSIYYKNFKPTFGTLLFTQISKVIADLLGSYPGKQIGFGGLEGKTVIRDWAKQARMGKYIPKNSEIDYERKLSELTLPILAINFEGDKYAPQAATQHLLAKMPQTPKMEWLITAENMGLKKLDHFLWAKQPDWLVPKIGEWVRNQG